MTTDSDQARPDEGQEERPRMTPPRAFDADADAAAALVLEPEAPDEDPAPTFEVIAEGVEPEQAALFDDFAGLPMVLESLLFVADHPIEESYLARALDVTSTRIERALDDLEETLRSGERGIRLQRGPEGAQLVTAPEAAARIEHFLGLEASRKLSTAALETLAIIAYRQPITRGQIDTIRGVSSDGAVATLRARALIAPAGYAAGPGRPMLFQTTQRFLEHFGLERAGQLPPLPDEIHLPPGEISEQLGLEEHEVIAAMAPPEPPVEEPADVAVEDDARVEIPADLHALSEAAEAALAHAAEAAALDEADADD